MNPGRINLLCLMGWIGITAHASEPAPLPPLQPKPYRIGIAPAHITVTNGPMLTSSADWPETASGIDLFKYYGVQLVGTPWATPVNAEDLVALARREHVEIGCEFGGFPVSDTTGEVAIRLAFKEIDPVFAAGGKVSSLHLDGPICRQIKGLQKDPAARSLTEIAAGLAMFFQRIHAKYPELKIGLITNFPNWDYTKDLPGRMGQNTDRSGVTYQEAINTVYNAITNAGQTIAFVEVDNPYNYYRAARTHNNDAALDNARSILELQRWCEQRGIAFHMVVNAEPGNSNKSFHELTLEFIHRLRQDGIFPDVFIVQSWYKQPEAQIPESTAYTFTNTAREAIKLIRSLYPLKAAGRDAQ